MPSKTKNRRNRNKTKNRRNTRRQRGGNFLHTISLGLAGTPDAPRDTSSEPKQTWAEWAGISSDSKQSWAESDKKYSRLPRIKPRNPLA